MITAATSGIKQYVLTPDEARSILSEQWAEFDIDVDLDELTEEQRDQLDRINVREAGQGPQDDEPDTSPRQNPQLQNGGGQAAGQNREGSQPTRTATDSLDESDLDAIADRVVERLSEDE